MNGGDAFGICTVAADCQAGWGGDLGGEISPEGVGTDAAGNVYVADGNTRIQKFDSSGNWLRAWGKGVSGGKGGAKAFGICTVAASCKAGSTGGNGGELSGPRAVATDAAGHVYVDEADNNRISVFDSSGNWLRAWGKGVNGGKAFGICTVANHCRTGSIGARGGEMFSPRAVAVDSAGSVYVADHANERIQKF